MDSLAIVSALCGWIYTFCWSLSFYPQPLLNLRRRTTAGTTIDFPMINCLGFLAYLVSNASLLYSRAVRTEYAARHHGLTPTVAFNDVAFAAHALVLSLVTVSQYVAPSLWWDEPGGSSRRGGGVGGGIGEAAPPLRSLISGSSRPSRFILGVASGCFGGVGIVLLVVLFDNLGRDAAAAAAAVSKLAGVATATATSATSVPWGWLDVVYALGYVKLVITLVKYSPQVLANWRNRSTRGWSIWQILLDFSGGMLSIAQLLLDSYRQHDWSGISGNPVKLALGNVSMAYDMVFITQHYVLYKESGIAEGDLEGRSASSANSSNAVLDRDGRHLD